MLVYQRVFIVFVWALITTTNPPRSPQNDGFPIKGNPSNMALNEVKDSKKNCPDMVYIYLQESANFFVVDPTVEGKPDYQPRR